MVKWIALAVAKYPMLVDLHPFIYHASVPWPSISFKDNQLDWIKGVDTIEFWLNDHIGQRLKHWAWNDSYTGSNIGVSFRLEQHRLLFVLTWS